MHPDCSRVAQNGGTDGNISSLGQVGSDVF